MRRWDIFCTVVDNFGDIGTCWRLAQQLADEHQVQVRLWIDRLDRLAQLCPAIRADLADQRAGAIDVRHWPNDFPIVDAADVVIEAFGCKLPETYIAAMASRSPRPVWINLEYLSAEAWVEECHRLPSPHSTWPLTKYFFFPGFTTATGGVLRERNLHSERAAFDDAAAAEFWRSLGIIPENDELKISLFCYDNSAFSQLLECWVKGSGRIRVLATPGPATQQICQWSGNEMLPGQMWRKDSLTIHALPFLPQPSYDRLLWASDVNFVRGEDSFVRAQWAQKPFVWQIYPQSKNAHHRKLDAFLGRFLEGFPDADVVRRCWLAWNDRRDIATAWQEFAAHRQSIQEHGRVWACHLDQTGDLANNLVRFVAKVAGQSP